MTVQCISALGQPVSELHLAQKNKKYIPRRVCSEWDVKLYGPLLGGGVVPHSGRRVSGWLKGLRVFVRPPPGMPYEGLVSTVSS